MTVKEWALRQIHWMLQEDPWVQEIFMAAGASLDTMAERILTVYNFIDFSKLNLEQVRYYEWLLGLESDEEKSLEDRRAAIQAAWQAAQTPSLESIQAICDSWRQGEVLATYDPGVVHLNFRGDPGEPVGVDNLKYALECHVPAHLILDYLYRYLLIREVHEVMTLEELETHPMNHFDFSKEGT